MAHKTQDERAEQADLAMAAAGISGDDVARVRCGCAPDGTATYTFYGDTAGSDRLARVVVDSDDNATVED